MTKQELIASAIVGDAHIDATPCVTRYQITPRGSDDGGDPIDYPLIVVGIRNSDSAICEDETYFTDGVNDQCLTDAEGEILQQVIDERFSRPR